MIKRLLTPADKKKKKKKIKDIDPKPKLKKNFSFYKKVINFTIGVNNPSREEK